MPGSPSSARSARWSSTSRCCRCRRFWNEADGSPYRDAYFGLPGCGGMPTADGRRRGHLHRARAVGSTINRGGVRMGSAIYAAVDAMPEIAGSLVIGAEFAGGDYYCRCFRAGTPRDSPKSCEADPPGDPRRGLPAARSERHRLDSGPADDIDRQEDGGANQTAYSGHTAGEGGQPGHCRRSDVLRGTSSSPRDSATGRCQPLEPQGETDVLHPPVRGGNPAPHRGRAGTLGRRIAADVRRRGTDCRIFDLSSDIRGGVALPRSKACSNMRNGRWRNSIGNCRGTVPSS